MATFVTQDIEVKCGPDSEVRTIQAEVYRNLALHHTVTRDGQNDTWAITYVKTGQTIGLRGLTASHDDCLDLLEALAPMFDNVPDRTSPDWTLWAKPVFTKIITWRGKMEVREQLSK